MQCLRSRRYPSKRLEERRARGPGISEASARPAGRRPPWPGRAAPAGCAACRRYALAAASTQVSTLVPAGSRSRTRRALQGTPLPYGAAEAFRHDKLATATSASVHKRKQHLSDLTPCMMQVIMRCSAAHHSHGPRLRSADLHAQANTASAPKHVRRSRGRDVQSPTVGPRRRQNAIRAAAGELLARDIAAPGRHLSRARRRPSGLLAAPDPQQAGEPDLGRPETAQ